LLIRLRELRNYWILMMKKKKLRIFYDKRMSQEVKGDDLGEEFRGYVFRITGGNDKQGFPMKQGVLVNKRVRLLMGLGHSCFRPRRTGERQRKSIRGCIVGADLAVLSLVIVKPGSQNLPGLTDKTIPRRLGPKRASKIRKLFNLGKQDDVRKSVIRRDIPAKEGKKKRAPLNQLKFNVWSLLLLYNVKDEDWHLKRDGVLNPKKMLKIIKISFNKDKKKVEKNGKKLLIRNVVLLNLPLLPPLQLQPLLRHLPRR